ncbi:MAG: hypothetical protein HY718_21055 [Planctomycetes bacterium]|nr:hypothetical protein [Planctomycetota bacterium]
MSAIDGFIALGQRFPIAGRGLLVIGMAATLTSFGYLFFPTFFYQYWKAILIATLVVAIAWSLIEWLRRRRMARKAGSFFSETENAPAPFQKDMAELYEQLRQKFLGKMKELKNHDRTLYSQPWYLLMGEPGCGKTQSLIQSGLDFPLGKEELAGFGGTVNYNFWIHAEAIVLDTAGRLAFHKEGESDRREWEYLLRLLKKHRSAAPMNGVIIAVAADSFFEAPVKVQRPDGSEEKSWQPISKTDREAKATILRDRLRQLQKELKIRFPVWLLVTKADLVPGFVEFFRHVQTEKRYQMIGWSRPDSFQARYDPKEFPVQFDQFCERMRHWGLRFLRDQDTGPHQTEENWLLARFPEELRIRRDALADYVATIFQPNDLSPPPFFRGFYFTSSMLVGAPRSGLPFRPDLADIGAREEDFQEGHSGPQETAVSYFLKDLYQEKVFPERGLLVPSENREARRRRGKTIVLTAGGVMMAAMLGVVTLSLKVLQGAISDAELAAKKALVFTHHNEDDEGRDLDYREYWATRLDARPGGDDDNGAESLLADLQQSEEAFGRTSIRMLGWLTPGASAADTRDDLRTIRWKLFGVRVLPNWLAEVERALMTGPWTAELSEAQKKLLDATVEPDPGKGATALAEYLRWHETSFHMSAKPPLPNSLKAMLEIAPGPRGGSADDLKKLTTTRVGTYSGFREYEANAGRGADFLIGMFAKRWFAPKRPMPGNVVAAAVDGLRKGLNDYATLEMPEDLKKWKKLFSNVAAARASWDRLVALCEAFQRVSTVEMYDQTSGQWWAEAVNLVSTQEAATQPAAVISQPLLALIQEDAKSLEEGRVSDLIAHLDANERLLATTHQTLLTAVESSARLPYRDDGHASHDALARQLQPLSELTGAYQASAVDYRAGGKAQVGFKAFCSLGTPPGGGPDTRPATTSGTIEAVNSALRHVVSTLRNTGATFAEARRSLQVKEEDDHIDKWMPLLAEAVKPEPGQIAPVAGPAVAIAPPTSGNDPRDCYPAQVKLISRMYRATRLLLVMRDAILRVGAEKRGIAGWCSPIDTTALADKKCRAEVPVYCHREEFRAVADELNALRKTLKDTGDKVTSGSSLLLGAEDKKPTELLSEVDGLLFASPWSQYLDYFLTSWQEWYSGTSCKDLREFKDDLARCATWPEWYARFLRDANQADLGPYAMDNLLCLVQNVARTEEPLLKPARGVDPYEPARKSLFAQRQRAFEKLMQWQQRKDVPERAQVALSDKWTGFVTLMAAVDKRFAASLDAAPAPGVTRVGSTPTWPPKELGQGTLDEGILAFEALARDFQFAEPESTSGFKEPNYVERLIGITHNAREVISDQVDRELAAILNDASIKANRDLYPFKCPPLSYEPVIYWKPEGDVLLELAAGVDDLPGLMEPLQLVRLLDRVGRLDDKYKGFPDLRARAGLTGVCAAWRNALFKQVAPPTGRPDEKPPPVGTSPELWEYLKVTIRYDRVASAGIENDYAVLRFTGLFPDKENPPKAAVVELRPKEQELVEAYLRFDQPPPEKLEVRAVPRPDRDVKDKFLVVGPGNPLALLLYLSRYGKFGQASGTVTSKDYAVQYREPNATENKLTLRFALTAPDNRTIELPSPIGWFEAQPPAPKREDTAAR